MVVTYFHYTLYLLNYYTIWNRLKSKNCGKYILLFLYFLSFPFLFFHDFFPGLTLEIDSIYRNVVTYYILFPCFFSITLLLQFQNRIRFTLSNCGSTIHSFFRVLFWSHFSCSLRIELDSHFTLSNCGSTVHSFFRVLFWSHFSWFFKIKLIF